MKHPSLIKIYSIHIGQVLGLALALSACQVAGPNCANDFAYLKFEQIDADKDGKLQIVEYLGLFQKIGVPGDNTVRKRTFYGYDGNFDEVVDKAEFQAVTEKNGQTLGVSFGGCTGKDLSTKF